MTGYGKATAELPEKKINVEIKSLNSKAMDLSTRIAPAYREKEIEIRNEISKVLERGKVDFSLWIEKKEGAECNTYQPGIGGRILQTDSGYLGKHRHSCPYGLVSNVAPYAGRDDENGNPGIIGRGMESSARHGA